MGTKRPIADRVAGVLDQAPPGPCLDLFAGMSAVGRATADCRNVWCNDVQHFASIAAASFFTAARGPDDLVSDMPQLRRLFLANRSALVDLHAERLKKERFSLSSLDLSILLKSSSELIEYCSSQEAGTLRAVYAAGGSKYPSCLFSITYSGGFIGLQQAIDIDSIRYAVDKMRNTDVISVESHRWAIVALCYTLANISNSTGHFAQYLAIKESTKVRYVAKRVRNVWDIWRRALGALTPLGTQRWRKNNKVFRSDAVQLLDNIRETEVHPAVIYADPPYTSDHYSRYYHLWDTLVLYDYPRVTSKGQYRADRFYSPFSIKTRAHDAFRSLIERAATLKSTFVLSYPDNGLFADSTASLGRLLADNFSHVEVAAEIDHVHSSLGASKGREKAPVTERIFLARN